MPRAADGTSLQGIGQIVINVKDLARATGFYRDVLQLPLLFEVPTLAFFDAGGVRLMLAVAEDPRFDHPGSILYYRVGDIRAAAESLRGRGATITSEPHLIAKMPDHELWMAFLEDSEGNTLGLMSEVR
ncbi:MAG: VOC family protein [Gemmatimonadales bacterium]